MKLTEKEKEFYSKIGVGDFIVLADTLAKDAKYGKEFSCLPFNRPLKIVEYHYDPEANDVYVCVDKSEDKVYSIYIPVMVKVGYVKLLDKTGVEISVNQLDAADDSM